VCTSFFYFGGEVFKEQNHTAEFVITAAGFLFTSVSFFSFRSLVNIWNNPLLVIFAFFVIKIFIYLILSIIVLYVWTETSKPNISILLISYLLYTIIETVMKWKLVEPEN